MSERIWSSPNGLFVTAFAGGTKRGPCLQFNIGIEYIQMDARQVDSLIEELTDGLLNVRREAKRQS